jgi:hypothetical protein
MQGADADAGSEPADDFDNPLAASDPAGACGDADAEFEAALADFDDAFRTQPDSSAQAEAGPPTKRPRTEHSDAAPPPERARRPEEPRTAGGQAAPEAPRTAGGTTLSGLHAALPVDLATVLAGWPRLLQRTRVAKPALTPGSGAPGPGPVLFWARKALRGHEHPGLDVAIATANALRTTVLVLLRATGDGPRGGHLTPVGVLLLSRELPSGLTWSILGASASAPAPARVSPPD